MANTFKLAFCATLAGAVLWLAPSAKADDWDKKTVMTFSGPVEIPGRVLLPGTYVFKLLNSSSDRTIVQVFNEDENELVATVMAIADYRLDTPDKAIVTFAERPVGTPEAIHSWFYPGQNYGIEFVYGKAKEPVATHENAALVTVEPAPAPTPEPAPVEVAAAPAAAPEPAPEVILVEQREEEVVVIAEEPADAPTPEPAELPRTAGNFALIPLGGITLLGAGFAALRRALKRS